MTAGKLDNEYNALSQKILHYANIVIPKIEFLRKISGILSNFSDCDAIEIWIKRESKFTHCRITKQKEYSFFHEDLQIANNNDGQAADVRRAGDTFEGLRRAVIQKQFDETLPVFTSGGSFWTGDIRDALKYFSRPPGLKDSNEKGMMKAVKSLAMIPLWNGDENIGTLELMSRKKKYFSENQIKFYENIGRVLAIALMNRRSHEALRERVKELTCLYEIANLQDRPDKSLDEILTAIVDLLPPAWQYPEFTTARIILDGRIYATAGFKQSWEKQRADIVVKGESRGFIEVAYTKMMPILDEGPFLKEERNLINTIAKQVAQIFERIEARREKLILQEQIRHADRLATIGQLAAGVAHELNEPLANILGFAQLIKKDTELSDQAGLDSEKIVNASLHAREVIQKLMLFARQTPPKRTRIDLNELIEDGLYFLEARCAKAGIEVIRELSSDLPPVPGDSSQLNQVLINLVVNSIQAMPEGGELAIRTKAEDKHIAFIVEDTGIGMSEEVRKKIFIPFFTTKDVNEGTGLGLAVVHGIVVSHGGSIKVESRPGKGSTFEVRLPRRRPKKMKEKG